MKTWLKPMKLVLTVTLSVFFSSSLAMAQMSIGDGDSSTGSLGTDAAAGGTGSPSKEEGDGDGTTSESCLALLCAANEAQDYDLDDEFGVVCFDKNTSFQPSLSLLPNVVGPSGLAASGTNLYVTDDNGQISVINFNIEAIGSFQRDGLDPSNPNAITIIEETNAFWVVDSVSEGASYRLTGATRVDAFGSFENPQGLTPDPLGNGVIVMDNTPQIQLVNNAGEVSTVYDFSADLEAGTVWNFDGHILSVGDYIFITHYGTEGASNGQIYVFFQTFDDDGVLVENNFKLLVDGLHGGPRGILFEDNPSTTKSGSIDGGTLYVSLNDTNEVIAIEINGLTDGSVSTTSEPEVIATAADGLRGPYGLAQINYCPKNGFGDDSVDEEVEVDLETNPDGNAVTDAGNSLGGPASGSLNSGSLFVTGGGCSLSPVAFTGSFASLLFFGLGLLTLVGLRLRKK